MNPTTPTEPIAPAAAPSTPLPAPTAQLQARVSYFSGITIASENYALLEWGADGRIRLFTMDADTNQAKEVIFDVALGEIEKVGGSGAMLVFVIAGKKYRVEFSGGSRLASATGSVIGLIVAYKLSKSSGVNNWLQALRSNNVKVTYITWGAIIGICIGLVAAILIVATIVAFAAVL